MKFPNANELAALPSLVPVVEVIERLDEAMRSVEKFHRNATLTVTYKITYDDEVQRLYVSSTVKSKRPVRTDRNEEVLGEDTPVLVLAEDIPGQQLIDEAG